MMGPARYAGAVRLALAGHGEDVLSEKLSIGFDVADFTRHPGDILIIGISAQPRETNVERPASTAALRAAGDSEIALVASEPGVLPSEAPCPAAFYALHPWRVLVA